MRRLTSILGLAAVIVLLTAGVALATQEEQLGGKLVTGDAVTIPAGTTVDHDLYAFGGDVTIDGTVNGDVVAAGGNVIVNGAVSGDLVAAAGQVEVTGSVQGDLRVAGGQIRIFGSVGEDVLAAGGRVSVSGSVGQDLIVGAGDLTISGTVKGSTYGQVGRYDKSGTVAGSDGIVISPERPTVPLTPRNPVLEAIQQYISVLVFAVLALWLFPRWFAAAEERARTEPLTAFLVGIASLIGYVVAVVVIVLVAAILLAVFAALGFGGLAVVDIFGTLVAILAITLGYVIVAIFLSDAIVGLALARVVAGRTGWSASYEASAMGRGRWSDLGLIAAGAAVLVIVGAIPVIGGLVKFVVATIGLGAFFLAWRRMRAAPVPVTGAPAVVATPPAE